MVVAKGESDAAVTYVASPSDWRLGLELNANGRRDRGAVIGVRPDAAAGFDQHDYSRPPAPLAKTVSLALVAEAGGKVRRLAGDFRAPSLDGWRFTLVASGDPGVATLELADPSAVPAGMKVVLRDPVTGVGYDLAGATRIVLPRALSAVGEQYELLVGGETWLTEEVGELQTMPSRAVLDQNYPNPFNPSTKIAFALPAPSHVRLSVFDAGGRRVAVLEDGVLSGGRHEVEWDGADRSGRPAASGLYIYRLETGGEVMSRRMLLVK
jgi:hypothetical protein